jgi:hypothetical protein
MPFGWFGPVSFKTKGGGRVGFFGFFLSLPFAVAPFLAGTYNYTQRERDTRGGRTKERRESGQVGLLRSEEGNGQNVKAYTDIYIYISTHEELELLVVARRGRPN